MPRRRMGRPGLVGTMARTAVVAGTASAVAGGVSRRQAGRAAAKADEQAAQQAALESQAQMAEMQAQLDAVKAQQESASPAGAPTPAAPAGTGDDLMAKLKELAEMRDAGVLDDAEFAAAKAKLLA